MKNPLELLQSIQTWLDERPWVKRLRKAREERQLKRALRSLHPPTKPTDSQNPYGTSIDNSPYKNGGRF